MIRADVRQALLTDIALQSYGLTEDQQYQIRGAVTERPVESPFIVLAWGLTTRGIGPVNSAELGVWCYTDDGDVDKLDLIIARVKAIMLNLPTHGTQQQWFVGVRWTGNSPDFYDTVYAATAKRADFVVTASGL